MRPIDRIYCAIDTPDLAAAETLAGQLDGAVGGLKLGKEFFMANGPEGVRRIAARGTPVFLDLKFHDIPNTVAAAIKAVTPLGAKIVNVHASGGLEMMRRARAAAEDTATDGARPWVIAVTVLTSLDETDLAEIGLQGPARARVVALAELAQRAGLDGVVCSAREIDAIRAACGPDFKLITPGIRPRWAAADDQKRIVTPADACRSGADILVIGRPITQADDPRAAAERIAAEMTTGR